MPEGRDLHRTATLATSAAMALLGIAIVLRTATAGGGPLSLGVLLGALFLAAGAGRFWVTWRRV